MQKTPKGLRLHIGLYGRRNVGKSSLLNAITRQNAAIVSNVAGTTADPVEKPMELQPIGPVLFIDTAGIDDTGGLGDLRTDKTRKAFERTDVGIIITEAGQWGEFEESLLKELKRFDVPVIVAFNKADIEPAGSAQISAVQEYCQRVVSCSATTGIGVTELRSALVDALPEDFVTPPSILGDLLPAGELAVFVVPIDLEAPKGRLILPQVQSIRDTLDHDGYCMIVKERELRDALDRLNRPPALVVTDSQAFLKVAADTPPEVPMTSFSILFARFKGELETFVQGASVIDQLQSGDRILIAEACSHHPIGEDIGTVKIPRWLRQYVGGELYFDQVQGRDFPEDLSSYKLVVHCGACMWNRRQVLSRLMRCRDAGVPITNYGLTIARSLGVLERALSPFPEALAALA